MIENILLSDSWCGEPISWIEYDSDKQYSAHILTRELAVQKYGEITNEEFGPKGGWKSVTFGNKKFISKYLKK